MAGEFLQSLMRDGTFNRVEYQQMTLKFFRTIEKSYIEDRSRPTRAETKRRWEIIEAAFRMLRSDDFKWTTQRILDELPKVLRAKLDGIPWEPSKRSIWTPSGS